MENTKSMFITIEGPDGSGKSSISKQVYEYLLSKGYEVILTREPGGVEIAEQIRKVILDPENTKMDPRTEALLYAAARRQHLVEKVMPNLQQGKIVMCDRFLDSSLAYQGYGRDIGIKDILQINEFAINGLMPDLTIYLDVDASTGLKRLAGREKKDRLDMESIEFHNKVTDGYNKVAMMFPERIVKVDATKTKQEVVDQVIKVLEQKLS